MAVVVRFHREQPVSVRLKVSPAAAVLTGLRFGSGRWPDSGHHAGGGSAEPLVHLSASDATGVTGPGACVRPVARRRRTGAPRVICTAPTRRPRPAVVPPHRAVLARWSCLRRVLEKDLRHRMARLANGGLTALFADLHPAVRLEENVVKVTTGCGTDISTPSGELVLMPSLFCDRVVVVAADPRHPPLLLYPARVRVERDEPVPPSSARDLVDDGSLAVALDLLGPHTIDEVAGRHRMRPEAASGIRDVLASSGFLAPSVESPLHYRRTDLAAVLVSPYCEYCS